ncbi:mycofactocin-coupled SDR family oxidoreductase [Mycolicibacterium litorale]|uniref:mycofactocin-coupled SDR family oxidoreductase n=1 Tax=Mycolicibacterium litorale TaxID=758802 RepID=UPI003CEBE50E
MGKLDGKVAFITGAARGQGRSHAIRLAEEGADIIGVDICAQISSIPYELASNDDLTETVREVEARGRRMVARRADVRDRQQLAQAFGDGVAQLGGVDIVLANAGVSPTSLRDHPRIWQDVLDVNLNGVFHTVDVAAPTLIEQGRGGAIVITGSTSGAIGVPSTSPSELSYTASKHAVVGLMRSYANVLAPHSIRVTVVHPTAVNTYMATNPALQEVFNANPDLATAYSNALPVPWVEPIDISNAIAWLVSDEGRFVTGTEIRVDAGLINKA